MEDKELKLTPVAIKQLKGIDSANQVEKSKRLIEMRDMPFNLGELKILDTFLSRINARDETASSVVFSVKEYTEILGIDRIKPALLNSYVTGLQGKIVTIPRKNENGIIVEYKNYTLFENSRCYKDSNTKQWMVELNCTDDAKKFFFNLENGSYFKYTLKNILVLSSSPSVHLYLYCRREMFRGKWSISVDKLKDELRIDKTKKSYEEYKVFNRCVLTKAINDINANTDITIATRPIRNKKDFRFIDKIEFSVETKQPQLSFNDYEYEYDKTELSLINSFSVVSKNEFTTKQLNEILEIVREIVPYGKEYPRGLECARFELLNSAYAALNTASASRKIGNRFSYFKGILRNNKRP